MNRDDSEGRMVEHGVRPTAVRKLVLGVLDAARSPVSSLEIEQELDTVDRSSITRTLAIFADKGLVHIIEDGSGAAKYESCPSRHNHRTEDMHVHFHCRICGRTVCLPETAVPPVPLPPGFTAESANYIISGICKECGGEGKY